MKRYFIGLTAVAMAFVFAAFTIPQKVESNLTNNFYRYKLSTNLGDDNPSNYEWVSSSMDCGGSAVVCIINSPGPAGAGAHPNFPSGTDPYNNTQGVSVVSQKP